MPEHVFRRSAAFIAQRHRRLRLVARVLMPILALTLASIAYLRDSDWKLAVIVLAGMLGMLELSLWLGSKLGARHLSGIDLELALADHGLELRRPGFSSKLAYDEIGAVKAARNQAGAIEEISLNNEGAVVLSLRGFERMEEIFEQLATATGGRALVEPARKVRKTVIQLAIAAIALVLGFIELASWSRAAGLSADAFGVLLQAAIPASAGVYFLVAKPISQSGRTASRKVDLFMGIGGLCAAVLGAVSGFMTLP
jgi:hypothetical protein